MLTKQIVPISDFRLRQSETLTKMENGPVYLAQRSKPVAVLVTAQQWDETMERLAQLERERLDYLSMIHFNEMLVNSSMAVGTEEYQQMLEAAGLDE